MFDGEGAFRFGGRWNSRGTRILYTAGSLSLAALEMLVHLNSEEILLSYSKAMHRLAGAGLKLQSGGRRERQMCKRDRPKPARVK